MVTTIEVVVTTIEVVVTTIEGVVFFCERKCINKTIIIALSHVLYPWRVILLSTESGGPGLRPCSIQGC